MQKRRIQRRRSRRRTGVATNAEDADSTGDIIVTASKRSKRLQDVPVTVSVVDGAQLARQKYCCGSGSRPRYARAQRFRDRCGASRIRGIGSVGFSRSSEGSVGVVIDNVSLASGSTTTLATVRRRSGRGPFRTSRHLVWSKFIGRRAQYRDQCAELDRFESAAHADIGSREFPTSCKGRSMYPWRRMRRYA